ATSRGREQAESHRYWRTGLHGPPLPEPYVLARGGCPRHSQIEAAGLGCFGAVLERMRLPTRLTDGAPRRCELTNQRLGKFLPIKIEQTPTILSHLSQKPLKVLRNRWRCAHGDAVVPFKGGGGPRHATGGAHLNLGRGGGRIDVSSSPENSRTMKE